jgi:hypothetical protein
MGLEIIGAGLNYNASKKAAKTQGEAAEQASEVAKDSTDKQLDLMRQVWEQQQKDQAPYLGQGQWAINRLGDLMGNRTPLVAQQSQSQNREGYSPHSIVNRNAINEMNRGQNSGMFDHVNWGAVGSGAGTVAPLNFGLGGSYDAFGSDIANAGFKTNQPSGGVLQNTLQNTFKPTQQSTIGGSLNNPFDSYLASKGLANGQFDTNNPQYKFLQKQGLQALDRSAAARGMGYSGAQMKALNEYGQGLASQQYDKEYNRANNEFTDYYNRLASLSQGGQQAAQSLGGMGSNYSSNAANTLGSLSSQLQNNLGQGANARASGYMGRASAINNGIQQMTDNAFRLASLFGGGR